jgi:hypothetical protein
MSFLNVGSLLKKSLANFQLLILLGALGFASASQAYIEAHINSLNSQGVLTTQFNPAQRTHVIVLGNGAEFGLSAFATARLKALKWLELAPRDQILILAAKHPRAFKFLESNKFEVSEDANADLTLGVILGKLTKLNRIASFEVYSHSNPPYGPSLDTIDKDSRYYLFYAKQFHSSYVVLKSRFTADAFAVFYGCNSAWKTAPLISLLWGIPVAGAMTATEFQILGKDGRYRVATDENKHRYGVQKLNGVGFQNTTDCGPGCYRLRPENANYNVYWGHLKAGLPFYKFFCANPKEWVQQEAAWAATYQQSTGKPVPAGMVLKLEGSIDPNQNPISADRCLKTMARFMMVEPSVEALSPASSLEQFKTVVKDFLCPHGGDGPHSSGGDRITENCMEQLDRAEAASQKNLKMGLNFMARGANMAQCDLQTCQAKVVCESKDRVNSSLSVPIYQEKGCRVVDLSNKVVTTMVDEYLNYISGYKLLKGEAQVIGILR